MTADSSTNATAPRMIGRTTGFFLATSGEALVLASGLAPGGVKLVLGGLESVGRVEMAAVAVDML